MTNIASLCWPASRAAEGIELLARAAGLPARARPAASAGHDSDIEDQVASAAEAIGLQADDVDAAFGEVDAFLRAAAPAVVRIDRDRLVMLARRSGGTLTVVRPDHRIEKIPLDVLRRALVDPAALPLVAESERLVADTEISASRRPRVVQALVAERLRSRRLQAGWLIRVPSSASFRDQLAVAGARRRLILLAAAHTAHYAFWILAWWLLGRAALKGHVDSAWLTAWTLALFTLIPLELAALWIQGKLAIVAGSLLKQRLLAGALRLQPEEIRREGAGQLLGRVIESEAVGSLAIGGGFMALLAILELVLAAIVLALATPLLAVLLVVWVAFTGALAAIYLRRRTAWVGQRVGLTHDLIERMVGHRTRIAQQPREQWHRGEDETLERYVHASSRMDDAAVWLLGIVPRGWMVAGLAGLTPLFVQGGSPAALAVSLGGLLLAVRAFERLTGGLWSLAGALIAWRQTAVVFHAATRGTAETSGAPHARRGVAAATPAVLEATDLRFGHAGRGEPVLQGCHLTIGAGDRIILQGPSGGGKSTLASLLAGLRTPQSGLVLLDGLDRHTVGFEGWRRRVVLVPQFHENHLVLGSVAFNLLMGVQWPPAPDDFDRADAVLRELGLGPTLDRMPSGLLQTVGETGWQLSHGERSRLYLARALLQNPDILILDESFAQLDPANMHLALTAVTARPSAVLLIAHP
jgi:ATP-binding cassette, subfamily B, bacterial